MATIHEIYRLLAKHKFPVSTEESLQGQIEAIFRENNVEYQREVVLSPGDRIDFMVGNIGIEVKIKGTPKAIYRQCGRYCKVDQVRELLLVTNRAMGLPEEITGKSCYLLNLGKGWL